MTGMVAVGENSSWLSAKRLFDGEMFHPHAAIEIRQGRVVAGPMPVSQVPRQAFTQHIAATVVPGFVDIQINGGGGVLFNDHLNAEGLATIGQAHAKGGTTAWLPTLITDKPGRIAQAALAVAAAFGQHGVAGLHLEGPHISAQRKGAHRLEDIRPFDDETDAALQFLLSKKIPVLLTLAPETVPPGLIARLTKAGVVVSIGHTAATADQVRGALAEGARLFTHVFNAMPGMTSRDPGVVGVALDSEAWCSIIADGHHVDKTMLRLSLRAKLNKDRMVLVSDAMPTWNGPPEFSLYGEVIKQIGGKLVNAMGSLAGVHADMRACFNYLRDEAQVSELQALRMACSAPADVMGGLDGAGYLRVGSKADCVIL